MGLGANNQCCEDVWASGCQFTAVKGARAVDRATCRQFRPPSKGSNVACHYAYAKYDAKRGTYTGQETVQNSASTNYVQCTKWQSVENLVTILNSRPIRGEDSDIISRGGSSSASTNYVQCTKWQSV